MEFEDVDEQIEWEARRAGASFGVQEWERRQFEAEIDGTPCQGWQLIGIESRQSLVEMYLYNPNVLFLGCIQIGHREISLSDQGLHFYLYRRAHFDSEKGNWEYYSHRYSDELMARGLYCLGLEAESILSPLSQLSAHEKLELRLSMPRKFWPKTWLNEEGTWNL